MTKVIERFSGVDEMIKRLDVLPERVDAGLRATARQASAAGYRKGLKALAGVGLDPGTVIGYRRWFTSVAPDGTVHLWLGRNMLRRAGDFEDAEWKPDMPFATGPVLPGRRQRANVQFPAEAEKAIQDQVVPEIEKVYEGVAEREILKAVARG